jgi:hypothetical protein
MRVSGYVEGVLNVCFEFKSAFRCDNSHYNGQWKHVWYVIFFMIHLSKIPTVPSWWITRRQGLRLSVLKPGLIERRKPLASMKLLLLLKTVYVVHSRYRMIPRSN